MKNAPRRSVGLVRIAAVTAAVGMTIAGLVGCSSTPSTQATDTISIVLHDNPATTAALKTLTTGFEKANPNIKVNLSFTPSANYAAVRTSRLAANTADIVEGPGGGPAAVANPDYTKGIADSDWVTGVKAGNWVDLTDQAFIKNFEPTVMSALAIDGKQYQVPTSLVYYTGVYYNKDIFAKQGLEVPTTWDGFVKVLDSLKAANIIPLAAAGKDQWPVGLAALALVRASYPTAADMQALDKGLWTGSVSLADPKNVDILGKLNTLYGYMDPAFAGVDYATAQGEFTGGKAAMIVDGTWSVQQFATQNPSLNMGYFPLPASNDAASNQGLQGKIDGLSFAIPSASTHQASAEKWIAYYADPKNYAAFATDGGVIPVQPNIDLSPVLKTVLGTSTNGGFQLAWDQIFHNNTKAGPNVGTNGYNYVGLAPLGKFTTADSAQQAAQADWVAGLPK